MAAQNNAQTIAVQLDKVRDKVPLLYERDDVRLSMIQQRGDVEKVSSRNMRLPLQVNPGGKAGSYNADGGDLGAADPGAGPVTQLSIVDGQVTRGCEVTGLSWDDLVSKANEARCSVVRNESPRSSPKRPPRV